MPEDMNKALGILLQTEEVQLHSIKESFSFTSLEKKDMPQKLHSILEACEISL